LFDWCLSVWFLLMAFAPSVGGNKNPFSRATHLFKVKMMYFCYVCCCFGFWKCCSSSISGFEPPNTYAITRNSREKCLLPAYPPFISAPHPPAHPSVSWSMLVHEVWL
jgi:hypothetical protein